MMLCGHNTGECQRQDIYNNNTVRSFMTDYQGRTNGGSGFMRLMEFSPRNNKVLAWTLSPYYAGWEHDADSQFEFYYNMESGAEPFVPLATFANVASGETISATWPGLNTSTTYEWYVTLDDGAELISSESRRFTTENNAAPLITLSGASTVTLECHDSFADPGASANDPEDGPLTVSVSGTLDPNTPGLYTLTYTATDSAGASASAIRTVQVVDTAPPALTILGENPASVQCGSTYSDAGATASDACAGDLTTAIGSVSTVNLSVPGSYTVTYNASDPSGNTASTTRTVQVIDRSAPVLALNGPASMTVECGSPFADPGASAVDACAGTLPVTGSGSVNTAVIGDCTLTYTAADASGNTGTVTRTVRVVDSTAPVIVLNEGPSSVECHSTFTDPGAIATDACAGSVTVIANGALDANVPGAYTLTYTATDLSGNTATATRTVTVRDSTPPVVTLNGLADSTVECQSSFTDEGASAADSCAGSVPVSATGSVDPNTLGTYILSYKATDAAGNSSSATRTVRVVDTAAPTIALLGANPLILECHTVFSDPGAAANDVCAGNLTPTVSGELDANTPGSYTLTYTATDPSGNFASATRTVQVNDTIAPQITLVDAAMMTIECHGSFTDPGATATDTCAGVVQVTTTGSVDANTPGNYTLTYTATDPSGNTATATRSVTVEDTTAPTVTLNGASEVILEQGTPFIDPGATATDACAGGLTAISSGTVDVDAPGTYPIIYSAADNSGNTGTVTRTVIVMAVAPPAISIQPQPVIANCGESVQLTVAATGLGQLSYQWKKDTANLVDGVNISGATSATLTINPVSLADDADYSVVVANRYGSTSSAPATLAIVDAPPAITLKGASELTIECHTAFNDEGVTTSDACSANVTVVVTGSVNPNATGNYTLTYTATDSAGQSTSVTRTVNVVDTTVPVITLTGDAVITVQCHTPYTDQGAVANDSCAGPLTATTTGTVNVTTPGTYIITYTAADPSGNTASASRTVQVVDTFAPAMTLNGAAEMTLECHSTFEDPGAAALDDCAGTLTVAASGNLDVNTPGNYTVSYTAVDPSGNRATLTRIVHIVDTVAPVITLNGASTIALECHSTYNELGASALDACSGVVDVTITGTVDPNKVGSYILTYQATDTTGHPATTTRTVTVSDTLPPVVTLTGPSTIEVEFGSSFTDPGATATDVCAGSLAVTTTGLARQCKLSRQLHDYVYCH